MKKIFTLVFAMMMAMNMMAQMPNDMKFAGAADMKVAMFGVDVPLASDTVVFSMNDMTSGNITFPSMQYTMGVTTMIIPSFVVKNVAFSKADGVATMAEQEFSTTVTDASGAEKTVAGKLSGTYSMAASKLSITAEFKYGTMPASITYTIDGYYIKAATHAINVCVGGAYNYQNSSVTYYVRKYMDGDVEKVDVEVPTYALSNTIMGDLTLGTYTVKGLTYDETQGGYYRDYANDGLVFHFKAVGDSPKDGDYGFNTAKPNNILVKYNGSNIADIINNFQMGTMPFPITSTFYTDPSTGISSVKENTVKTCGQMFNLQGQQVGDDYKGVVIMNGKKFVKK